MIKAILIAGCRAKTKRREAWRCCDATSAMTRKMIDSRPFPCIIAHKLFKDGRFWKVKISSSLSCTIIFYSDLLVANLLATAPILAQSWPTISFSKPIAGFANPTDVAPARDASGTLFVVEQAGRIRIVKSGILQGTAFLDITDRVGSTRGTKGLDDTVDVPAGSKIAYKATGTASASATGAIADTVTVTSPNGVPDPDTGNNTATNTDTL